MKSSDHFISEISQHVWNTKYRYREKGKVIDQTTEDTWKRVSKTLAESERSNQCQWEQQFYNILTGFKFLPGGRILAGAGTNFKVTLLNCFVMGMIKDNIPSIFNNLKEGALTMQQGGGIGYDFSTLRPKGSAAKKSNNISSGPVSFMKIWDTMCDTMLSTGARRGAMMATLRCDHPDITEFIFAKHQSGSLTNFNLSVLITDEFMNAVHSDTDWPLVFPINGIQSLKTKSNHIVQRKWSGSNSPVSCVVVNKINARMLWESIMKSGYDYAEPGVLFIDHINRENNLGYCEQISATNPCGEVPLPPYGACDLGSLNLTQFILNPFTNKATVDFEEIRKTTRLAVRMLDNVLSISRFPLPMQQKQSENTRRIGLGITGLADALIMLKLHYGSSNGREIASKIMKIMCHESYRTSCKLAREKGTFPSFQKEEYLSRPFILRLPQDIRISISESGIRNSHLLSIAPTGSISILANNISSGIEPVYDFNYTRKILNNDATTTKYSVTDYAFCLWKKKFGDIPLPQYFVSATQLPPIEHLNMQAALQLYVDNSISKTINIPENYSFEEFKDIYRSAYELELKGCTAFRPNTITGSIFENTDGESQVHCCTPEREAD